jgi:hypothetical protein
MDENKSNGPLAKLSNLLAAVASPASLKDLEDVLGNSENLITFLTVVHDILPDRAKLIMAERDQHLRVAKFAKYFEERYFPLHDFLHDGGEGYESINFGIPFLVKGLGWEDYENLPDEGWKESIKLIAWMTQSPLSGDDTRIAIGEACKKFVPVKLLNKIPKKGYSPDEMHKFFDRTKYAGAAICADWLNGNTGNSFLDTDYEMQSSMNPQDWDMTDVKWMTTEWQKSELLEQKMFDTYELIEKDIKKHFALMLERIEEVKAKAKLKKGTLMEVFSDQDSNKEGAPAETGEAKVEVRVAEAVAGAA